MRLQDILNMVREYLGLGIVLIVVALLVQGGDCEAIEQYVCILSEYDAKIYKIWEFNLLAYIFLLWNQVSPSISRAKMYGFIFIQQSPLPQNHNLIPKNDLHPLPTPNFKLKYHFHTERRSFLKKISYFRTGRKSKRELTNYLLTPKMWRLWEVIWKSTPLDWGNSTNYKPLS